MGNLSNALTILQTGAKERESRLSSEFKAVQAALTSASNRAVKREALQQKQQTEDAKLFADSITEIEKSVDILSSPEEIDAAYSGFNDLVEGYKKSGQSNRKIDLLIDVKTRRFDNYEKQGAKRVEVIDSFADLNNQYDGFVKNYRNDIYRTESFRALLDETQNKIATESKYLNQEEKSKAKRDLIE